MRWFLLVLLVLISLAVLAAPVLILHPFKEETLRGLTIAHGVKEFGVWIQIVALLFALSIALQLWRGRWWRKVAICAAMIVMLAATVLARVNHFEKMFRPLPRAQYASIGETNFVDADDMVMTVTRGPESAAYPIRQLAYHHIVQDVVGGVPIVVTY